LIRVILNLAPERKEEALIMRILIAIITILPNLHSAFMLMEIIIITNANLKRLNDHLKIKERFQQLSAWLQPFQETTKWPLSSNTSNLLANSNTSPSTNHSNHLHNNRSHRLFLMTLLNSMDNLNKISITNIILIIRHIQE
jgi:hypothetical protein